MYSGSALLERFKPAGEQTSGGVLKIRQGEMDGGFPASRADLCPLSHWYTAAVVCLAETKQRSNEDMYSTVQTYSGKKKWII